MDQVALTQLHRFHWLTFAKKRGAFASFRPSVVRALPRVRRVRKHF